MAKFLIVFSTIDGQTLKICRVLQQQLEYSGHSVTVSDVAKVDDDVLSSTDVIVIGASIRYGKYRPNVAQFIERNRALLDSKRNAFFSVNIVARKPGKNTPEANPYLRKFLKQACWRPELMAVFAGKLDYPSYRPLDRMMIRLIMLLTHGPTDPSSVIEFTDWGKVASFGKTLAAMGASGKKKAENP